MSTTMKTMQSKACIFSLIFFFLLSFSVSIQARVNINTPETICNSLRFSGYCKSILPRNKSATVHDCGRNSFYNSISMTNGFRSLVDQYLNPGLGFPESTVRALQDCKSLASLNQDFLSSTIQSVRYNTDLPTVKAEDMRTLLSAALTNQETCLAGLQEVGCAASVWNALAAPLLNGRMSYSVSLAFFLRGWGGGYGRRSWPWIRFFVPGLRNRPAPIVPKGVNATRIVFVNPNPGQGNFRTISDAVVAAPNNTAPGNGYYVISVAEGVYEEYVSIPKNKGYIMMIGAGINRTIITGNRSVVDGWTTFNSSTFAVVGQGFVGMKMTFRNTAGAIKQQAVAVRNGADLSTFYQCSFEGYQDTLYTHSLRQFYKNCDIYGTVDFIFGNAAVVLQTCNIRPRLPLPGQFNTITAQGRTDINQNTGTSIQDCVITPAPDLASNNGSTQTYLGRPWKTYSRTIVMQSYLGSFINPKGWAEWSGNTSLDTLYYAEYNNTGPGSVTTDRVNWPGFHLIDGAGAVNFTVSQFLVGNEWLNGTGVPFFSGLI